LDWGRGVLGTGKYVGAATAEQRRQDNDETRRSREKAAAKVLHEHRPVGASVGLSHAKSRALFVFRDLDSLAPSSGWLIVVKLRGNSRLKSLAAATKIDLIF
jgi:hypothetical protein